MHREKTVFNFAIASIDNKNLTFIIWVNLKISREELIQKSILTNTLQDIKDPNKKKKKRPLFYSFQELEYIEMMDILIIEGMMDCSYWALSRFLLKLTCIGNISF